MNMKGAQAQQVVECATRRSRADNSRTQPIYTEQRQVHEYMVSLTLHFHVFKLMQNVWWNNREPKTAECLRSKPNHGNTWSILLNFGEKNVNDCLVSLKEHNVHYIYNLNQLYDKRNQIFLQKNIKNFDDYEPTFHRHG